MLHGCGNEDRLTQAIRDDEFHGGRYLSTALWSAEATAGDRVGSTYTWPMML